MRASSLVPENSILKAVIKDKVEEAAEVVKNPPKIPSFILGFVATLLTGLSIIKIKRTS